jgi:hypothetical protein
VVAIVVHGAATAPAPPTLRRATADERAHFAQQIAMHEDEWRRGGAADFPTDAWSQRDAFHNHEMGMVRDLAGAAKVPAEDVLRAIDEDLHRPKPGVDRSAEVVPLKPRPIFD